MTTWTHEQTVEETADTNGIQAYGTNVKAGSLLLAMITADPSSVFLNPSEGVQGLPTDTLGNTWKRLPYTISSNNQYAMWWYAIANGAGANTVTLANPYSTLNFKCFFISEWSVDSGTIKLDVALADRGDTAVAAGTDAIVFPSLESHFADGLCVAIFDEDNGSGATITAGTGFTMRRDNTTGQDLHYESRVVSSPGTVTATMTPTGATARGPRAVAIFTTGDTSNRTESACPVTADADDGQFYYSRTSWPAGPSGTFTAVDGTTIDIGKSFLAPNYFDDQGLIRVDTSVIPDDATLVAAWLDLEVTGKNSSDDVNSIIYIDYYDFGGEPSVAADWISAAGNIDVSSKIADPIKWFPAKTGDIFRIWLRDLSGINKTGYTGLRLAIWERATPTSNNFMSYAAYEHATAAPPQLTVVWTPAVSVAEKQSTYYYERRITSGVGRR